MLLLVSCYGCDNSQPRERTGHPQDRPASDHSISGAIKTGAIKTRNGNEGTKSSDILTIENGKITEGRPKVTESVQREIYKSLNYRRKMMGSIQQNSGSSRGIQQMRDELEILSKGFMSRYGLTQLEIDQILQKGDVRTWD